MAGRDSVVANFVNPNATHFLFPHVVDGAVGGATYNTLLMLDSYQSSTVTATLTLTLRLAGRILVRYPARDSYDVKDIGFNVMQGRR